MMKYIIFSAIILSSNGYYMGPGTTFRLGAFTCESANISIGLEFESDNLPVNFITYAPDTNYGCVNIINTYSSLSVRNAQEFSGTLIGDEPVPLCYAFQNPSSSSGTTMNYYMNIVCVNNSAIIPAQIINQINTTGLNLSIFINCLFAVIIIVMCWMRKNKTIAAKSNTIEPVDIKL